jgi:hypothetical protein
LGATGHAARRRFEAIHGFEAIHDDEAGMLDGFKAMRASLEAMQQASGGVDGVFAAGFVRDRPPAAKQSRDGARPPRGGRRAAGGLDRPGFMERATC